MKLNFGILWFEDNHTEIEKSILEDAIRDVGFRPHIEIKDDGSEIDTLAEKQNQKHIFDLVLIDLSLAKDEEGDILAKRVRELFSFTPILFYSGGEEVDALKDRIAKLKIEGVFCSHRDQYSDSAIRLINNYAPSLERLTGMRGLAAQVVTEMDVEFRDIIRKFSNEVGKREVIEILDAKIEEIQTRNRETIDVFEKLDLKGRLDSGAIVGSRVLLETTLILMDKKIENVQDETEKNRLQDLRKSLEKYRIVLSIRNDLTHRDEDEKAVAVSNFPKFRRRFVDCLETIEEIHKILFKE